MRRRVLPELIHTVDKVSHRLVAPSSATSPWRSRPRAVAVIAVTHEARILAELGASRPRATLSTVYPCMCLGQGAHSIMEAPPKNALGSARARREVGRLDHRRRAVPARAINGLGYFRMGLPSPYVWASTDQITAANTSLTAISIKCDRPPIGCAALLARMTLIDPTIQAEWHP